MRQVPGLVKAGLIGGGFLALLWWERKHPLRREVERSRLRHEARNLVVATLAAASVQLAERPVVAPLSRVVERRRLGLLKRLPLPRWAEVTAAVLLLDYTLYVWHVLTHKVPLLWRFHQPHHVDLDLTATTGIRFHFGELIISVLWRAAQVRAIGVSPLALSIWQTALLLSVMFHHSNAGMPVRVERWLSRVIVTPRMHGIHHSTVREEADSNWSSGLTVWDWLHGTLKRGIPQQEITIGVPAYQAPEDVTLPRVLEMPFDEQRESWRLPDGTRPRRERLPPGGTRRTVPLE